MAVRQGFAENGINYVPLSDTAKGGKEFSLRPGVVGVLSIEDDVPQYLFGYDAVRLANASYIDEGGSAVYNAISGMIDGRAVQDGRDYRALRFDRAGAPADLCSRTFKVHNRRAAHQIKIETSHENGGIGFGGNNPTHRIMQLLKLELAVGFAALSLRSASEILKAFDTDIYRFADERGAAR